MTIGIVGSEAAKFTPETEAKARAAIRDLLAQTSPLDLVVSGGCHLGGIDSWAKDEAIRAGIAFKEFLPAKLQWEGGYKQRNMQIAKASDIVVCITVKSLPEGYKGMRFASCYHCGTDDHVKSGGCYTVKQAEKLRKRGFVVVIT